MKKRLSILLTFLFLFCVCFPSISSASAYFSKIDFVTQKLNFSINGGFNNEYIDKASVSINYYTYNGTENVLAHKETYASLGQSITVWGEAPATDEEGNPLNVFADKHYNFIGWSVTGLSEKEANNVSNAHIGTYEPDDVVPVVRLQAEQGLLYTIYKETGTEITSNQTQSVQLSEVMPQVEELEGGETEEGEIQEVHLQINLYDIYDKNTLTIKQHSSDPIDNGYGYTLVNLVAWDSMEALERTRTNGVSALEEFEFVAHYKSGTLVRGVSENDIPLEFSVLFSDGGVFKDLTYYHLTKDTPSLTFYFHPGRVYSSSFFDFAGGLVGSDYIEEYVDGNGETKKRTQSSQNYLYLTDGGRIYNDDGSFKEEGMFTGAVAPDANVTLYAADNTPIQGVVNRSDSGFDSDGMPSESVACFTTGTLITLADGSQIPVEDLTEEHYLMAYDHDLGRYTATPALLVNYTGNKLYTVASLTFADGEKLELINERGLFDITLNKYVYIKPDNCKQFVGHKFAKAQANGFAEVELISAYKRFEYTGCYSVTSTYYINHFIDGYLTVPGGFHWFVNYFEYGENLKYDEAAKARDIATYGLYTIEDFAAYLPEDMLFLFDVIYPAQYLKVAVGKGLAEFDDILTIIQDWILYYGLSGKLEEMKPRQ